MFTGAINVQWYLGNCLVYSHLVVIIERGQTVILFARHCHIFAYAKNRGLTLAGWKKIFGKQCHVEKTRGTVEQACAYCSKEAPVQFEQGEKPMDNGHQKSRHEVVELMEEGERPMKIARTCAALTETIARYANFWDKMWLDIQEEKMNNEGYKQKQVFILVGKTDAGKTRSIYEQHGYAGVYRAVDNSGKWFDGYKGQPAVLFDECGPGAIMPVTQWLSICDGYPLSLPVKGGFVPFRPECIYFTSNIDYTVWWPDISQEHLAAVKRRITEVRVFKPDGTLEFQ